jgi:hypothetical protein
VAEIVTGVLAVTAVVVMVNAAETVAPAGTVTDAGIVALGSLLASVTTTPPEGAAAFNLTELPVEEAPPTTRFRARVKADTTMGVTVRFAVLVTPS